MTILKHPHQSLRTKCTSILDAENTLNALEEALIGPVGDYIGVGLAANQIGIHERVCIIRYQEERINLVNPVVVEHGEEMQESEEGCLSVDDKQLFLIKRWTNIVVQADNYPDLLYVDNFDISRIIQHELDHLDGKLIIDYQVVGRNDPCFCGSGLKHKKCCGRN